MVSGVIQWSRVEWEGPRAGVGLPAGVRTDPAPPNLGNYIPSCPCSQGSQPEIEICGLSKACSVGRASQKGMGQPALVTKGVMRSGKGGWFHEASSHKTLHTPSLNPLPLPTPHCQTPFCCPTHSLPTDSSPGTPPLPNVCTTHWFCPLLLLSGSIGPCPAALDQTVPCRVRKSASSMPAESRLTCLPLKP